MLALAAALQQAGRFSAAEWAAALAAAIARAQAAGDPDDGSTYYAHVLDALEQLVRAAMSYAEQKRQKEAALAILGIGTLLIVALASD